MAKVTLQVVVNDTQVNKLQERINSLNNTKVTIGVQDFTKNLKDTGVEVDKLNGKLTKTVRVFNKDGELVKGVDNYKANAKQAVQVTHKLNEETGNLEQTSTKVTETIKKQGLMYDILGRSLTSFLARMAAYRAVYAGIRAITNGINEALTTMKALDDELVTVRKVTGFSAEQMAEVQASAYSVASKYGVNAADYASGVAAFARAGYKEASGALAELAQKTMIVGDTTAEVANQFLLSVDAAYKYGGSIEALSRVLDGANELDNKYATSIEKIAEGMGIVAPVAAQMHVGIDELAASIGTITAVTQRSGSETARALRALYLNIVGDTKTEIEEGVTWTTGEIEGLRDVIKLYAKDAYDAAQATGGIIDPMKAMEGLAKSLKDGVLTEAQLMEMVSDIGGKLRTSQLLALINNWDMYESMLNDYRNAYGSADKEIENAMDSWTRKTAVLKNTWTEFIQKTFRTETFKKFIDGLTNIIKHLDSVPGVLTRIALAVAGLKMGSIISAIGKATTAIKTFFAALAAGNMTLSATAGGLGLLLVAISAIWSIISKIEEDKKLDAQAEAERAQRKAEEAQEALRKSRESIQSNLSRISGMEDLRNEYLEINSEKYTEAQRDELLVSWKNKLAEAYGVEKSALEGVNKERRTELDLLDEKYADEVKRAHSEGFAAYEAARKRSLTKSTWWTTGTRSAQSVLKGLYEDEENPFALWYGGDKFFGPTAYSSGEYLLQIGSGKNVNTPNYLHSGNGKKGYTIAQEIDVLTDAIDRLSKRKEEKGKLEDYEVETLQILTKWLNSARTQYEEDLSTISDFLPILARYNLLNDKNIHLTRDSIKSEEEYNETRKYITENYSKEAEVMQTMLDILEESYPQYAKNKNAVNGLSDALNEETFALGENEKALKKDATAAERAAAAKKDAEETVRKLIPLFYDETGALSSVGVAALSADANLATFVQTELQAELAAKQANFTNLASQLAVVSEGAMFALSTIESFGSALSAITGNSLISQAINSAIGSLRPRMQERFANMRTDLTSEINLIQAQIAALAPYLPSTGTGSGSGGGSSSSSSSTNAHLKSLQDRVSLLKSELSLMQTRGDSEEDILAKMRQIQEALKAEESYLKSIGGSQIDINKLEEEWWSYQNKIQESSEKTADANEKNAQAIQAAVDAQIALNNALKERNVHVFNSETGQWEWQANPTAVSSARNALISAAQNLPDGVRENFMREYGINLPSSSTVSNVGGTSNYGNTYNFGNFTLTEEQARSMSVYELARLSSALGAYNNSP